MCKEACTLVLILFFFYLCPDSVSSPLAQLLTSTGKTVQCRYRRIRYPPAASHGYPATSLPADGYRAQQCIKRNVKSRQATPPCLSPPSSLELVYHHVRGDYRQPMPQRRKESTSHLGEAIWGQSTFVAPWIDARFEGDATIRGGGETRPL